MSPSSKWRHSVRKRAKKFKGFVFAKTGGYCFYCKVKLSRSTWSIDHRIPIIAGGTNELCNLVPSCRECNELKGSGSELAAQIVQPLIRRKPYLRELEAAFNL